MSAPGAARPVVVTGGTGFVGAHLVRRLVADGVEVHLLGRAATDGWRLGPVADRIVRHDVDLADPASRRSLGALLADVAPGRVFHLAGAPLVAGVGDAVEPTIAVNVFGSHAVVEAAAAVAGCSIVTIGDAFEYEDLGRQLREADADDAQPPSIHGLTRLTATRAAHRAGEEVGRVATEGGDGLGSRVSTVRLFSVLGTLDHPRRLVPRLIEAASTGAEVPLSDPSIVRDWVHVDDVIDLLLRAADLRPGPVPGGRVFNAGSGHAATLGDLVAAVEELTGATVPARWGAFPPTEHDAGHWVADPTHTATVLGWRAAPLTDALGRVLAATP